MIEQIRQFFREVKVEMKKVSWPSRDELSGSTSVVIFTVFIVSMYIFGVDLALRWIATQANHGLSAVFNLLGV